MPDKKPKWSDYAYDNDSISKRLDISKEDVKKLKAEAASRAAKSKEGIARKNPLFGIGIGATFSGDVEDSGLRAGIKIPGLEVTIDTSGNGSTDILNLIKIETIRIKCYYVQRFYFAGQFLYSDIIRVDSEECNKEPEPEPEPPDPSLDDIDENKQPKPSPKIPNRSEIFQGIFTYTQSHYSHETNWENDPQQLAITKSKRTTKFVRMNLNDNPYYDLWKITHKYAVSFKNYQPSRGIDLEDNDSGTNIEYFCWMPVFLRRQGIITGTINAYSYNGVTVREIHRIQFGEETPYGVMQYGYSVNDNIQTSVWGDARGNTQSVPFIITNFKEVHRDFESWKSFTIHEVNQIINFDSLVTPQKTKNSPIRINNTGEDMDQDCCRLLRKLAKYQGLGQSTTPINVKDNKIEEKGGDDIFPIKIPARWIDRESKPKDDYEIKNMRHLILSIGIMLDRFEELFNPAGKDKGFPLKKPEEGIWKWLPGDGGDYEAPDPNYDPKKSKEDGKIKNKKLKINTYLDLFRYFLESQIRLEMLFPIAQIRDSEISKRLIYPKAPGKIKINDMIQLQELLLLYLNKTFGDPTASVIIKDADPTKEGDQPLTIENFDVSDMLRKLIRFSYDINSDVDLANNFGKRTLYQLLSAMQVLVTNHSMTEAIFEDLGMKEEQAFVPVRFFADPYAGGWKAGEGFDPKRIKIENTEKGIEANLEAFLQEKEVDVKVSRRAKDETTDLRDLLSQIGRYAAELAAQGKIPNTPEAIQQAIDKARFELQTESALRRTDVRQASAAGRVRTKRNKSKGKKP